MKHYPSQTGLICLLLLGLLLPLHGQNKRIVTDFNQGWTVYPAYNVNQNVEKQQVDLPHTWNAGDAFEGIKYDREAMIYQKRWEQAENLAGKRVFLLFEGANSVAHVFVNGKQMGEHYGGYTAFCFEITEALAVGKENRLEVYVSNAHQLDVIPLSGDFNVYGGLHRPVKMIVTDQNCISPLDYASSGIYIKQKQVSEKQADLEIVTKLSCKSNTGEMTLRTRIYDPENRLVKEQTTSAAKTSQTEVSQNISLTNPVLWNGKENPALYSVSAELLQNGKVVDEVTEKTGFRYFSVDPEKGFFLNGKHLDLHGFGKHVDLQGKGSAITEEDYRNDMELILESGATSLRLTHYPHGKPIYDLSDEAGIILWTEIPFVGPGGYTGASYVHSPAFEQHTRQMLVEMIRQNFNHPSVCFWGLFNEVKLDYDDPTPFVEELNSLAKKEDPSRLTTLATFLDGSYFQNITDLIAWNKYYGWYGGESKEIGTFVDKAHKQVQVPLAISEYGAGGSIQQHQWPVKKPDAGSNYHPEEWQTVYHEDNWQELSARPFVWGKYIWVFADFGSSIRNEGDRKGINDKGLITYDHKTRKDAFYFYKANWNPEPMVYITSRRFTERTNPLTAVKVFTNAPEAELFINNKRIGKKKADQLKRVVWEDIKLEKGTNEIVVKAKAGKKTIEDRCEWVLTTSPLPQP